MKQSLQLKIGQSLTMTPQLQQAIKLLQLSNLDLQSEIQETLDSNPLLEAEALEEQSTNSEQNTVNEKPSTESSVDRDTSEQLADDKIASELQTDTQWEDWGYTSQGPNSNYNGSDSGQFDYQGETSESLRDQLQFQIDMTNLSEIDYAIATILIDSIDDRGYLQTTLEDVVAMFAEEYDELVEQEAIEAVEVDEVEAVLHLLQSFEPAGIAARNLQECLIIQLRKLKSGVTGADLAEKVIQQQFEHLSSRNYRQIMRAMNISESQLKSAIDLIQTLDPRPGNQLTANTAQYIIPDVFVSKDSDGIWGVELNGGSTPKLKINDEYAALIKRADNSPDNTYLKNNLQEAKWFIKSLQSRNETLLKVASCIVSKQIGFLEYGEEAMKPLVLNDIAEEVDMHESTISRVTTQKFMHTPRGIFELKYFFSSHVGTTAGGECSSTAIRAVIKKLISAENQAKPLSDSKLANLLKDQGIKVARRTVAKYREAMSIPPSNERKRLL